MPAVCTVSELPPGSSRIVEIGRLSIGVYNVSGRLFAIRNFCPHRGAPLCTGRWGGTFLPSEPDVYDFALEGRIVRCPWHQLEYDLETGRSLMHPDRYRVATYPVRVIGGDVVVDTKGER